MRLVFIRHGEPDYDRNTLTEKGFRESRLLKDRLVKWHIDDLYSSPIERAYLTAEPTLKALGRSAVFLDWMKEFYFLIRDPLT